MQSLNALTLNRLDKLIDWIGLHRGEPPVQLCSLLENFAVGYSALPERVEAITVRRAEQRYIGMRFNHELADWGATARKRHAEAHELAHVLLRHRGDFWIMYRAGGRPGPFDAFLDNIQERQCDLVAAYLLVPLAVLFECRGLSATEIAVRCDVPVLLVELRWIIWRKFGR